MTLDLVCIVRNYFPTIEKVMAGCNAGFAGLCVRFALIIKWHRVELLEGPLWPPYLAN